MNHEQTPNHPTPEEINEKEQTAQTQDKKHGVLVTETDTQEVNKEEDVKHQPLPAAPSANPSKMKAVTTAEHDVAAKDKTPGAKG